MAKLCDGLCSGRFSMPNLNDDGEIVGQNGITPSMFKNLVGKGHPEFSTMRQQAHKDSHEFIQHILKLIEQKERAGGRDPTKIFKFRTESRLQCTECMGVRYKSDASEDLRLRIPAVKVDEDVYDPVSLRQCLDLFAAPDSRQFNCSNCKRQTTAEVTTKFETLPDVLLVPMNRFIVSDGYVMKKLNIPIDIPAQMDLAPYVGTGMQDGEIALPEDAAGGSTAPAVDQIALQQIEAMGFPTSRAIKALEKTGNNGTEVAMAWLFEHMDDVDEDPAPGAASGGDMDLSALTDMGFTTNQAKKAMAETGNNIERAIDWLFSHAGDVDDEVVDAVEEDAPRSQNSSTTFNLIGFISHKGPSVHCGHYVAHLKKDDQWVLYNDNKVVAIENFKKAAAEAYIYIFARK
ncbi:hypothetical protein HK101_007634 [Irineochytrium annulatum]|nr:hypothetical protein HK101_007634 [Irineochytrium annulatum]